MTVDKETTSIRFVIWKGTSLDECNPEGRQWLTQLLNSHGLETLRDVHGMRFAELGKDADGLEQFLNTWDLGKLVHVWWPGSTTQGTPAPHGALLDQRVDILDLSVRSTNCLEHAGIKTIGELVSWSTDRLLRIKNMGRKSANEIRVKLASLRLNEIPVPCGTQLPAAPQSFCLGTLLSLKQCEIDEGTLDRLHKVGISRLDDLVTRNREFLRYWVGLSDPELLDLQERLSRVGLSFESSLPIWLRKHFQETRESFEEDIERLLGHSTESDSPVLLSPGNIAAPSYLEEELETFLVDSNDRDRGIVRRLLGWDGGPGTTLEQAGTEFQMTRERVRQILLKSLRPVKLTQPILLKRAIDYIDTFVPAFAEDVEAALVSTGILRGPLRLEVIEETAKRFEATFAWEVVTLNSRRILVNPVALERIQEFLTAVRKRVSHYGTTRADYVLAELADKPKPGELNLYFTLLEDLVWLDESHNWFWFSTGKNSVLNRLAKIFRVLPKIELEVARKGVLRDKRMEGTELPPEVFRALCASLKWCRIEGEELINTAAPDQRSTDDEDTDERVLLTVLRQYGPVMRRRDLWRLTNSLGVEKVSFDRLLGGSNIIVKHAPEIYGLIGSEFALPPEEMLKEHEGESGALAEEPIVSSVEQSAGRAGVLENCNPESTDFHEQVLATIVRRSTGIRSSGTWSLMELGLTASDFQTLRTWSNFGTVVSGQPLRRTLRFGPISFSGTEALALAFLASCCEIGRNSSSEGELWPSVDAEIGLALKKEVLASYSNPKPRIRDATESVCSKLNIRHVFGREGEQSWFRSVFLQFGMTRSGWKRLPGWLSGNVRLPVPIEALLGQSSGVQSPSFSRFWQTLQRLSWQQISQTQARQALAESTWVTDSEVDGLLSATVARPEVSRSDGRDCENLSQELDSLIGTPRLTWRDEPLFELPLNGCSRWLTEPRYVLVLGAGRRVPISREGDEYVLNVPDGKLEIDLREPTIIVDLHRRQVTCLPEPLTIRLAPEDRDFAFYDQRGALLPYGEEEFESRQRYLLLCRSKCEVTVQPAEIYVRRVFQGEWTVHAYRDGIPNTLEIHKDGVAIWTLPYQSPAHRTIARKPRVDCPGGRWGERAIATVHHIDGSVPRHLVVGSVRIPIETARNGKYQGVITLSPNVDYRRVPVRLECEWEGRLRRISADLTMGSLNGIAIDTEEGWKAFREAADVDAEYLSAHRLLTLLPSHYGGEAVASEDWVWMEGDHFCERPRNTASTIGRSLHAIGESLNLSIGPYNRPFGGQKLARSVVHSGVVQRVERNGDVFQIQLRRAFERSPDHAIWVWHEDQIMPEKLSGTDWIQEDDVCRVGLHPGAQPVAFALSFQGAWLGARTCEPGWQGLANLVVSSTDWKTSASWLRWWRVPLCHEGLKWAAQTRVVEARIATLLAWTSGEDLCGEARFSMEHEDAWRSMTRNFLWDWRPSADESAAILKGLGLLSGDPDADVENAWDGCETFLAIHPLLLAQAAYRGMSGLYPGQDREDLEYWLGKLRNRILGLEVFAPRDRIASAQREAQRRAAETMAVDEFFVVKSLLRDAVAFTRGIPIEDHNLRVAISNSQTVSRYLAAVVLEKMINGEIE
jgi:hypothetical protein